MNLKPQSPRLKPSASKESQPSDPRSGQPDDALAANRREHEIDALKLEAPTELPISAYREEIVELLRSRQVIVVCGETGSGKSTQLPKFCLEAGLGKRGRVGHTQPRRLAARSIAERVSEELGTQLGRQVGYQIRFGDQTSDDTLVKLMTDGILLAETQTDRTLKQYDAIIIDEAHERSLNIDFLLGYLRRLQPQRPDLRIIITSATIDAERFAEHFADEHGPAPILNVEGRGFPVETRYLPWEDVVEDGERGYDLTRHVISGLDEIGRRGDGDVLVFLPTERDIREVSHGVGGHYKRRGLDGRVDLLPLYARLPSAQQQRIFHPTGGKRRIIFATNVAESSLTVPGIHFVIDSGTARISRFSARTKVQRLPIEPVSRASANQRAGRCGRIGPGVCVRLFSEEDFDSRDAFTTPEIRRTNLASVVLRTKTLRLGKLEEFPLLDPPRPEAIRDGVRT
ncbi:MAG: helicase-related protein, partial [Planctomycetota bacterium]